MSSGIEKHSECVSCSSGGPCPYRDRRSLAFVEIIDLHVNVRLLRMLLSRPFGRGIVLNLLKRANANVLIDDVLLTQNAWSDPGTTPAAVNDSVVRSQTGRILQDTLTDGPTTETSTYSYDGAGRLVSATIPRHQLTYAFAATGGCVADAAAGRNGNRTAFTDVKDAGTPTSVAYCYDNADRLTATTVTNPPVGTGGPAPVAGANLTAATLQYDAHGNTTTLGNQVMTYDVADRHLSTTVTDTAGISVVTYLRDVTGRIVARTSTAPGGPATTIRYLFAAGTLFGVADGTGVLLEREDLLSIWLTS